MIHFTNPQTIRDMPDVEFLAILQPNSVYVEGDERSRAMPGHGYGAHTVHAWTIEANFASKQDWEDRITQLTKDKRPFKAVKMTPAQITTETTIDIDV